MRNPGEKKEVQGEVCENYCNIMLKNDDNGNT